ncbi:MAG: A/G-specific adenine glycosylase, partial [Elusimicrobia bacterium]|nr:A/G-specific adenine glycosylase [Elusimicrobiota bacterium]
MLKWYVRLGRHDLPWRTRWSLYHVLVSEAMLQQTTVATVLPYFRRFVHAFPTMKSLTSASGEKVLELWSGLGYYARARNLQAAAKTIVRDFGGKLPARRDAVESLPGVGPYTAGAILSFVYDEPEALVDGNVVRVLSRVYGVLENAKEPEGARRFWKLARRLVPPGGARQYNSALMDLGATVCRPRSPACSRCPFRNACWARRNGKQDEFPISVPRNRRNEIHIQTALARHRGKWLMVRRPSKGLYGGLWEFPEFDRVSRALRVVKSLPAVKQVLSHRVIHYHPRLCEMKDEGG